MKAILKQKYERLYETYHFEKPFHSYGIHAIIRKSLREFTESNKKIAIYCNGGHTKMLMSDFMYELKEVKYIIDNYADGISDDRGFHQIRDKEIEENGIDAVIISSFKFKDSIVEKLKKEHPSIRYLNIYDKFAENGIYLHADYYYHNHPYHHYHTINSIQREMETLVCTEKSEQAYFSLIAEYIHIKDFRTAKNYAEKLSETVKRKEYIQLVKDLEDLYETEKAAAARINEKNVLMFCADGLRRQDLTREYMPKFTEIFDRDGFVFDRAYSFSTSTFESLIPVYSENSDLRTAYYQRNVVEERDCRFLQAAKEQKRNIYFYTDMDHFIEGENIRYCEVFQTVTEKLWNFILDAVEEDNGLYYIHELYESHFSFANPYTKEKLISEGTALLFDYLPQKGGKLRADYERQHSDSLRYLDDVVSPFIRRLKCRMLLFADHGNLILNADCALEDIETSKLAWDEEWIRIPYIVRSPEMGTGRCGKLISLMSLNDVMIALLNQSAYNVSECEHIKVARSELYNPDFRYLYKKLKKENCLLAFEAFIFTNGYKLVIRSDGMAELFSIAADRETGDTELFSIAADRETGDTELFSIAADREIRDTELKWKLLENIKEHITVCDWGEVRTGPK